jgi:hypothetical protein
MAKTNKTNAMHEMEKGAKQQQATGSSVREQKPEHKAAAENNAPKAAHEAGKSTDVNGKGPR